MKPSIIIIIFAGLAFFGTIHFALSNDRMLRKETERANVKLSELEKDFEKLKNTNFDSLYRVTPYKNWKKIDSLVCGCYEWKEIDGYTKLGTIKDSIKTLEYYNKSKCDRALKSVDSLYDATLKIRTAIIKKKYPKQHKKELKETYELQKRLRDMSDSYEREKTEREYQKYIERNYKQTITATSTPYGIVYSVSYTKK